MAQKSRNASEGTASPERPAPTVLIIDDDRSFCPGLTHFLRRFGVNAIGTERPAEGLTVARERRPELILLDLCLDGGPSTDTRTAEHVLKCLKLDATTRDIPIITMSGIHHDASIEARFRSLGAESFYTKAEVLTIGPFLRSLQARLLLMNEAASRPVPPVTSAPPLDGFPYELTILVIDDEEDSSELLGVLFRNQPYRILWARTGSQGLSLAKTELPDLVVLDLHMPGLDGQEVCRRLRESQAGLRLPVLILTGEQRIGEQVRSFNIGADDYLLKGSSIEILDARMRALIRRVRFGLDSAGAVRLHAVALDPLRHELSIARREPLALTRTESGIMALLMSGMGSAIDVATIHKKVCRTWKPHSATVKVHVSNIRGKLGPDGSLIESINREESYRFNMELARALDAPLPVKRQADPMGEAQVAEGHEGVVDRSAGQ